MAEPLRFVNLSIDHPTGREREKGVPSKIMLLLSTNGGHIREAELTESELLRLVRDGAKYLAILRGVS